MKEVEEKTIDGIKVLLKMDGGAFCIRATRKTREVLFLSSCVTDGTP